VDAPASAFKRPTSGKEPYKNNSGGNANANGDNKA